MQCIMSTKAFNAFELSLQVDHVKSIFTSTPLNYITRQKDNFTFD